jgi:oligopeptide/dipeptide ABC transporter ATP-binding protein
MATSSRPVLDVRNLRVEFSTRWGTLVAVDDVSFHIDAGEVLGVVGESGAGKSITGSAVIGLLEPPGRIGAGEIRLDGRRIDDLPYDEMRRIRGRKIGAIFQDPMTSLNPLFTIGDQLVETIQTHLHLTDRQARSRALELLHEVGLPNAAERIDHYPHQFSGGMRQRVVIALSLCAGPRLVIADEPTTALDVSIQAQIIALLKRLCCEHGAAVMLITHDMGVIADTADRVAVMYAGRIGEIGPVADVIHRARFPYTHGLMGSIPAIGTRSEWLIQIDGAMPRLHEKPNGCAFHPRCPKAFHLCTGELPEPMLVGRSAVACWLYDPAAGGTGEVDLGVHTYARTGAAPIRRHEPAAETLIRVTDLYRYFDVSPPRLHRLIARLGRSIVRAVDGIDFTIARGETFALVGESGCGKSTVARLLVGLYEASGGDIHFDGVPLTSRRQRAQHRGHQARMQMIFQDPYTSLNPRWQVRDIVAEPIRAHKRARTRAEINDRVDQLLRQVGLSPVDGDKYPHEFSGGQRQRISIARALGGEPEFLVCDEPTSALDVSVQAQILNLMRELQLRLGLTYLFISHDLAVVHHIADRVGVMYLGRIVECAATESLFRAPRHPYTRMLLEAVPDLTMRKRDRTPVAGEVPSPINPPPGCSFHPRCPLANDRCRREVPRLSDNGGAQVACHALEEGRLAAWRAA